LPPGAVSVAAGVLLLPVGTRLGAPQLAALAAAGVATISCHRRPTVVVLTTGSELRRVGESLGPGEIYESNGLMLEVLLRQCGADVTRQAAVQDDFEAQEEAIGRALAADVAVTSGGVSVGPHDLVRAASAARGVKEVFWGVAVRPGKPVSFGVHERGLMFGLPGNPVSSLVAALLFVRTALFALQGSTDPFPPFRSGRLTADVGPAGGRDAFLRATLRSRPDGDWVSVLDGQDSHMIARAAAANALVQIPRGEHSTPAGSLVRYLDV
jgi:molybdopterin molybdotransferase